MQDLWFLVPAGQNGGHEAGNGSCWDFPELEGIWYI